MTVTAADLESLDMMLKPNLAWPFEVWPAVDLLTEFGRVTNSIPAQLESLTNQRVIDLAIALDGSDDLFPVCLTCQPYVSMASGNEPTTNWGSNFLTSISTITTKLELMGTVAHNVGYVILDIEHWRAATWSPNYTAEPLASHNAKLQIIIDLFAYYCPDAQLIWYAKGEVIPNTGDVLGWHAQNYFPAATAGVNSCSAYYEEWELCRQIYIRSTTTGKNRKSLVPFVALNCTRRRDETLANNWGALASPPPDDDWLWNAGFETNYAGATQSPKQFPVSACPFTVLYHESDPASNDWLDQFLIFYQGAVNTPL